MDAKSINALYANLEKNELACKVIGAKLDTQEKKVLVLRNRHDELWQSWEQGVLAIGNALTEAKQNHGPGWKQDFSSLGYDFSYTSASRYIACAKHPELGSDTDTVEAWATASADLDRANNNELVEREAKRKERAACRGLKQKVTVEKDEAPVLAAAKKVSSRAIITGTDRAQMAFDSLHRAIQQSPQYSDLRASWQSLVDALRQGIVPLVGTV